MTASGDLVITGLINGRGQFRGETLQTTISSFVAAFDAEDGAERWVRLLSGADGATEAMGIEVLDDGRIAIAGATSASTLAGEPSLGAMDVFLAWISPEGELLRVQRYGGSDEEYPTAFGSRAGSLFFARTAISLSSGAPFAVELTRVDASGAVADRLALDAPAQTEVIGFSSSGSGLCAGFAFTTNTDDAGPGTDYGFTCYTDEWQPLGSARRGTPGANAQPLSIDCTPNGNCTLAGYATVEFEGSPVRETTEGFIATFDENYALTESIHFGTAIPSDDSHLRINAITRMSNANLVAAGDVRGRLFKEMQGKADIFLVAPIPRSGRTGVK